MKNFGNRDIPKPRKCREWQEQLLILQQQPEAMLRDVGYCWTHVQDDTRNASPAKQPPATTSVRDSSPRKSIAACHAGREHKSGDTGNFSTGGSRTANAESVEEEDFVFDPFCSGNAPGDPACADLERSLAAKHAGLWL